MRNFILSVFLAVMPALSFAQEVYNSFLEEGKVWSYKKYNYFTGDTSMRALIANGDTIVGDVNYKKIADSNYTFETNGTFELTKGVEIKLGAQLEVIPSVINY